jgi:acyl-CoA reductase-like NAD-dependent aldehyde dehydrogenase
MTSHFFGNRVNCYDATMPQTPFGGFKMSGQGRELYVFVFDVDLTCNS